MTSGLPLAVSTDVRFWPIADIACWRALAYQFKQTNEPEGIDETLGICDLRGRVFHCQGLVRARAIFGASRSGAQQARVEEEALGPDNWPTTVQATVADILNALSAADKEALRNTSKEDLIQFHHGWGTGIRNYYGLWRGNTQLLEDACGKGCHPDDASMMIIEAVWTTLQQPDGSTSDSSGIK